MMASQETGLEASLSSISKTDALRGEGGWLNVVSFFLIFNIHLLISLWMACVFFILRGWALENTCGFTVIR